MKTTKREIEFRVDLEDFPPELRAVLIIPVKWEPVRRVVIVEDEYTEEEISGARLLVMKPSERATIDGGVAWGTTYDRSAACEACGTGGRQTSALFVNGEELSKLEGRRAATTPFGHVLVDEGLAEALANAGATGLELHGVYAVMPDRRQSKLRYKQLCAARALPRMSPRTTGLGYGEACWFCRRTGHGQFFEEPIRMVYRASDLRDADDVNASWEHQGDFKWASDLRESVLAYPWTLVTPKVRRVFRDAGVTSFDWVPIRVEDEDGQPALVGGDQTIL